MRLLISPSTGDTIVSTLNAYEGGTGVVTGNAVKTALNAIDISTINQPNGLAGLDNDGRIPSSALPEQAVMEIAVIGPNTVFVGSTNIYTISNYDMFTQYDVSAITGTVSRVKDVITYNAPSTVMIGGFVINGRSVMPLVNPPGPSKPAITSPVNNASSVATTFTLTSNAFVQNGDASTHATSDWQVATDANFTAIAFSSIDNATNRVSFPVVGFLANTAYFARVRYKASNGNYSEWSNTSTFTTQSSFVYNHVIAANTTNFSMRATALANGWNGVVPLRMTTTINSGVVVGSTSEATYSFDTGAPFPVGSELSVVNNGTIAGKGGNGGSGSVQASVRGGAGISGGPALRAQVTLSLTNNGTIGGGGGGGGGGSFSGYNGEDGSPIVGGNGGGGAGNAVGSPGGTLMNGGNGIQGGNAGGNDGGRGGALGNSGLSGLTASGGAWGLGGNGGSAGVAIQGNSNIAWLVNGTRLGAIT
jgi:hypothetical protein